MTNIAIVGAGTMGSHHADSCQKLPDVAVTWVADRDAARVEALAAKVGARATRREEEAIAAADVDAVVVAVPTQFHRPVTELAAAHGKHVFCEKPIARTIDDAEAMVAACRSAGVRLMIGHVVRFYPEYARIKTMLDERLIGQIGVVRASRVNLNPGAERVWYVDLERTGGLVVDMMIHDLDTLRWYFGEVERVFAHGLSYTPHQPTTDYALALLRFENGVIAHVEASWAHTRFRTAIELSGQHGTIRHDSEKSAAIRIERTAPGDAPGSAWTTGSPVAEGPYQAEVRHFLARLEDGAPFLVEGAEAIRSLALALAVLDSIRTGRPVHLAGGHPAPREVAR